MTKMTYTVESAREDEKCWDCGAPASVVLVADVAEPGTGYVDEIPLCEEHAEKRNV